MGVPANILQQVQTYQNSGLALLQNSYCFISESNKKYLNFQDKPAQLGSTVTFDKPPRFNTVNSLVAAWESADQRVESLTVDQPISTSFAFTAQEFIFNVEEYMKTFGKSAIAEIGSKIEQNVALNCKTAPYRFYGNGITPINSIAQLSQALALFNNYGAANGERRMILADMAVPQIVNSGLGQFAPDRNNEMANSWELGKWNQCKFMSSNLLPVHNAGTAGETNLVLTVVSTTLDANGAVTAINFNVSGAPGVDADMIKENDRLQFQDGVAGQSNLRYLTFIGHSVSSNPVQIRATADAASDGGSNVNVTIDPPLQVANVANKNINVPIVAGQQVRVMRSHRAGVIMSGDPLFLAMPQLPDQRPFDTSNDIDPETGCSIRLTYGSVLGQNTYGMIYDAIWGSRLVPEYSMAMLFPL